MGEVDCCGGVRAGGELSGAGEMGSGRGGGGGIGAALAAAVLRVVRGRSLPRLLRRLPRFSLGGVFLNSSNMRTTLDIPMTAAVEGRIVAIASCRVCPIKPCLMPGCDIFVFSQGCLFLILPDTM